MSIKYRKTLLEKIKNLFKSKYEIYNACCGDTYFSISKEFNMDLKELFKINAIWDPNFIQVGQSIKVRRSK